MTRLAHVPGVRLLLIVGVVFVDGQRPMKRIVPVDISIGNVLVNARGRSVVYRPRILVLKMLSKNNKWLALGLTSLMLSGCAAGGKPNLNLGISDALRKSKVCLLKQKLGYEKPIINTNPFGFGSPVAQASRATQAELSQLPPPMESFQTSPIHTHSPSQSVMEVMPAGDCGCNSGPQNYQPPATEFYMPASPSTVSLEGTFETDGSHDHASNPDILAAPSLEVQRLPLEAATPTDNLTPTDNNMLPMSNPLPASDSLLPADNSMRIDQGEEEGLIETLDSAASEPQEKTREPQKDENSILEAKKAPLKRVPTETGNSVIDRQPKIVTLTARPAESHQVFDRSAKTATQQSTALATHKRSFRIQNSLRQPAANFPPQAFEHTAEVISPVKSPVKFKPLPTLPPQQKLNVEDIEDSLLENEESSEDHNRQERGQLKTARMPLLKATTISSASILSLRNFTNVHDQDGSNRSGDAYYSKHSTTLTAEVVDETLNREPREDSDTITR